MAWSCSVKGVVVAAAVVVVAVTCLGGVTAEEEQQQQEKGNARSLSGFFSSKLGDLYKLRQSLLDAATITTTSTTPTTTTTITSKPITSAPPLPSSPLGWSSRAEGNSAFQGFYDMFQDLEDPQLPLSLEYELDEELTEEEYWETANSTFDPQLPLSHESLSDGELTKEVKDGELMTDVKFGPDGRLTKAVKDWRVASNTFDPQLPPSHNSWPDGELTQEMKDGGPVKEVKSGSDGELTEEKYWKAANNTHSVFTHTPTGHGDSENHWARMKGIFENMKSILQQMYPGEATDALSFSVLDRAIALGDNMHLLQDMVSSFDPGLLEYLSAKWEDTKASLVHTHPLLKAVMSSSTQELGRSLLAALMRQVGGILQRQAFTHVAELDFVTDLMRTSGFRDEEIKKVYELLDLPVETLDGEDTDLQAESRQFHGYPVYTFDKSGYGHVGTPDSGNTDLEAESRQYHGYPGYSPDKSGGYGHSGGYGMGGGYGYMQGFDPFVLLAGLAFATFLAYLIYRLLSSTAGGGKREAPDVALALDLSDLPGVMDNLYSWIEGAKVQYEGAAKSLLEEGHNLGWAANYLWENYQVDRLSRACVRRALCDYVTTTRDLDAPAALMEHLALAGLAQLFGEDRMAAFLDHVSSRLVEGQGVQCMAEAPACDDEAYRGAPRHPQGPDTPSENQRSRRRVVWVGRQ